MANRRPVVRRMVAEFPPELFERAEAAARELGVSMSALMRSAMEDFLRCRDRKRLVREIDAYFERYGERERETGLDFAYADAEPVD